MDDKIKILQFVCDNKTKTIPPLNSKRIHKELLTDVSIEYIDNIIEELGPRLSMSGQEPSHWSNLVSLCKLSQRRAPGVTLVKKYECWVKFHHRSVVANVFGGGLSVVVNEDVAA